MGTGWKEVERKIAAKLGGRRVPITGRARGDAPDIEHPQLSIEVKSRKQLPNWLMDAMDQAEKAARDGKLPVVVLHQSGDRYDDAIVLIRFKHLKRLMDVDGSG